MSYFKQNKLTSSMACWYDPETNTLSNKKADANYIYFASQHELAVYRQIHSIVKYKGVLEIVRQPVVIIKPPSQQLGILSWKVDFAIRHTGYDTMIAYIEAKGGWICQNPLFESEFYQKLHLWDSNYPDTFNLLYVVGDKTLCTKTNAPVKIWTLAELAKDLMGNLD